MEGTVRLNAVKSTSDEADTHSLRRCEHALELLLTHRGNPSTEIDQVLANEPQCIFAHCLRAALIVCGDAIGSKSSLTASISAIEAARPDMNDPARGHAIGARAWLEGDPSLAVEYYGGIVID